MNVSLHLFHPRLWLSSEHAQNEDCDKMEHSKRNEEAMRRNMHVELRLTKKTRCRML